MALGGIYETGTVTIAGDRVSVTGVGTLWTPTIEIGDWLLVAGQVGLVAAIVDDTHLTLETQWQGTLPAAAVYVIIKMSWLRYDPALTQAKVRELLEELDAQGNFIFVEGDEPDPAVGEDGQWALKTNVYPWQLWYKEDGVWVLQPTPAAELPTGTAGHALTGTGTGTAPTYQGFLQSGAGAITRTWQDKARESVNVKDFGATGTGGYITGACTITIGSAALEVIGAAFTTADVGKLIVVPGAGSSGYPLNATITSVPDATHVTLSANAATALGGVSRTVKYGANDGPAINNAINSLPVTGGRVIVPAGIYLTDQSIRLGNGTGAGFPSSRNGVRIEGEAGGMSGSSSLVWAGNGGGFLVQVQGPLKDFAVNNLEIDGQDLADHGLLISGCAQGETSNLFIHNCRTTHYATFGVSDGTAGNARNAELIFGSNITIAMGALTASGTNYGMLFDGASDGRASSCFISLNNVRIFPSLVAASKAITFKVADTVILDDVLVFCPGVPNAATVGVTYDYSGHPTFPCGCTLNNVDVSGIFDGTGTVSLPAARQFVNNGTLTTPASPNLINSLTELNQCRYPNLANLSLDLPRKLTPDIHLVVQTAAIGLTLMVPSVTASLYRINYYMLMRTAGSGGNIILTFSYQDSAGNSVNKYMPSLPVIPAGASVAGTFLVSLNPAGYLYYSTAFDTVTGSPAYDLHLVLEKMT